MEGLRSRATFTAGAALFGLLGRNRLYMLAQTERRFSGLARAFVSNPELEWLCRNWRHVQEDGQNPRVNAATIAHYLNEPNLGGWACKTQPWRDMHNPLPDQMRGLILPMLEARIREGCQTVVEIGSSNGDVLAYLAGRFPAVQFIGVDFVLPEAPPQLANLEFRKCYALEALERGELIGDVAFGSSTFCLPGPVEMAAYAEQFARAGFKSVLIADPVTRAYSPEKYPGRSMHQTFGMWGHDHRAIFARHGFTTSDFQIVDYTKASRGKPTFQLVRLDLAV